MVDRLMSFRLAYLRAIAESWKDPFFKEKLLNADDIQEILQNAPYSFVSPWKQVKIRLVDDSNTVWEPVETAGWVGANDSFVISIPGKPHQKDQQVQALAAYYQIFPDLFGTQQTVSSGPVIEAALPVDLGTSPEPFLEFGGVTLRALALAWENERFLIELTDPSLIDATPVLSKYLGYNNPWNFNIRFISTDFGWDGKNWTKIPKNVVELHYPRKPAEERFQPIALTSYNNTGPAYPFTCG